MKTVGFSETIAASDLKVSRSSHLTQYMKVCVKGQGHFLTLAQGRVHTKNLNQIVYFADLNKKFYESFQVQGNENLMT